MWGEPSYCGDCDKLLPHLATTLTILENIPVKLHTGSEIHQCQGAASFFVSSLNKTVNNLIQSFSLIDFHRRLFDGAQASSFVLRRAFIPWRKSESSLLLINRFHNCKLVINNSIIRSDNLLWQQGQWIKLQLHRWRKDNHIQSNIMNWVVGTVPCFSHAVLDCPRICSYFWKLANFIEQDVRNLIFEPICEQINSRIFSAQFPFSTNCAQFKYRTTCEQIIFRTSCAKLKLPNDCRQNKIENTQPLFCQRKILSIFQTNFTWNRPEMNTYCYVSIQRRIWINEHFSEQSILMDCCFTGTFTNNSNTSTAKSCCDPATSSPSKSHHFTENLSSVL